jgi:hypothetical protein
MSVSVLSISLGGILSKTGIRFSGAFQRQLDYAKLLKEYHIVTCTDISTNGVLAEVTVENVHLYPTNTRNRLDYLLKAITIGRRIMGQIKQRYQNRHRILANRKRASF